jgi:hypothetical protein
MHRMKRIQAGPEPPTTRRSNRENALDRTVAYPFGVANGGEFGTGAISAQGPTATGRREDSRQVSVVALKDRMIIRFRPLALASARAAAA